MILNISSNIALHTYDYQIYSWLEDIKAKFEKKINSNGICLWDEKLISLEPEQNILITILFPGQDVPAFDKYYSLKIGLLLTEKNNHREIFDTYNRLDSVVLVRNKRQAIIDAIRNIIEPVFFSVLVGIEYKEMKNFFAKGRECRQITLELKENSIDMVSKEVKRFLVENACFVMSTKCLIINISGCERMSLYELDTIADVIDDVFSSTCQYM